MKHPTHLMLALALWSATTAAASPPCGPQDPATAFVPDLCAVELPCTDVAATAAFYRDALAWNVVRDTAPAHCVLQQTTTRQGALQLLLRQTQRDAAPAGTPWLSLNVEVADLKAAVAAAIAHGGSCARTEPQPFALGNSVEVRDPAGNAVHLLTLADRPLAAGAASRLFNVGWHVADLAATERFWTGFGLQVFARDFLPDTLPMQRHGAAALVFHRGGGRQPLAASARRPVLYFAVAALTAAEPQLAAAGMQPSAPFPTPTPLGRALRLRDPDGLGIAVVERGAARLCFERLLAALPGTWHASSTAGWASRTRFARKARDSVLVEDDPQGDAADAMLSCITMDGDRLLLTHYCHAGNQPRLVADLATATATSITFRFLDGGNLASRDVGHMDEMQLVIDGPDRLRTQWQWYQDGVQRPMEAIVYEREKS
jgi:predicted enzyme related to lactoylglutathione lyase